YEIFPCLEFRRVLFRSLRAGGAAPAPRPLPALRGGGRGGGRRRGDRVGPPPGPAHAADGSTTAGGGQVRPAPSRGELGPPLRARPHGGARPAATPAAPRGGAALRDRVPRCDPAAGRGDRKSVV